MFLRATVVYVLVPAERNGTHDHRRRIESLPSVRPRVHSAWVRGGDAALMGRPKRLAWMLSCASNRALEFELRRKPQILFFEKVVSCASSQQPTIPRAHRFRATLDTAASTELRDGGRGRSARDLEIGSHCPASARCQYVHICECLKAVLVQAGCDTELLGKSPTTSTTAACTGACNRLVPLKHRCPLSADFSYPDADLDVCASHSASLSAARAPHSQVLGRADNLSSFVMHGVKEDASVTVELYRPNMNNLFITRTFSRKNNKSTWHMEGRCVIIPCTSASAFLRLPHSRSRFCALVTLYVGGPARLSKGLASPSPLFCFTRGRPRVKPLHVKSPPHSYTQLVRSAHWFCSPINSVCATTVAQTDRPQVTTCVIPIAHSSRSQQQRLLQVGIVLSPYTCYRHTVCRLCFCCL